MPRFSLLSIFYFVTACAGYFALITIAGRNDSSLVTWLANSLGVLYGTLLYVSGLAAFYVACRCSWRSANPSDVAVALPFAFLPTFVGLIGLVHGYISVFRIFSMYGKPPEPTEMYEAHATILVCLLVGLCLSLISFALLAIAMLVKCRKPQHSNAAPDSGG